MTLEPFFHEAQDGYPSRPRMVSSHFSASLFFFSILGLRANVVYGFGLFFGLSSIFLVFTYPSCSILCCFSIEYAQLDENTQQTVCQPQTLLMEQKKERNKEFRPCVKPMLLLSHRVNIG